MRPGFMIVERWCARRACLPVIIAEAGVCSIAPRVSLGIIWSAPPVCKTCSAVIFISTGGVSTFVRIRPMPSAMCVRLASIIASRVSLRRFARAAS